MYQWIVYVHVLSGFAFFLAHGAAAAFAFRLRQETNLERIRAMLDLSASTLPVMGISLLLQLATGVVAGLMLGWWQQGWIWISLGLLIVLVVVMYRYSQAHYQPLRKAVGSSYMQGSKQMPAQPFASEEEIKALIAQTNPRWLMAFGLGVPAMILYLMMDKPF